MNKARAMLDALMGPGRDTQLDKDKAKEKFKNVDVCKSFLVALCPLESSYLGGKRNFTACEKIHSDIMKQQFEAHPDSKELRLEYEAMAYASLKYAVGECDFRITKEKARMADDWSRKKPPLPAVVIDKLSKLKRESSALVKQAEDLDDDKFTEKNQLMAKSNELAKEAQTLEEVELKKAVETGVFEEVCEICGTCFTGATADAAHQKFKIHIAYEQIREKLAELESRKDEWSKAATKAKEGKTKDGGARALQDKKDPEPKKDRREPQDEREKDASKEKEKNKDKDRDKDRERDREKDREKDRDKDRERSRGRDRDRRRSEDDRSRSRGRGRDRRRRSSESDRGRGRRGRKDSRDASRGRRRRR